MGLPYHEMRWEIILSAAQGPGLLEGQGETVQSCSLGPVAHQLRTGDLSHKQQAQGLGFLGHCWETNKQANKQPRKGCFLQRVFVEGASQPESRGDIL